jgi:hypothetical protein
MGLLGIARRAGAARGAYMAELENYHRQRQGLYDDMALRRFGMDQQRFDMDRRKFNEDLIDREAQRKRDAEKHQWAGEQHKDNLSTNLYRRDALRAQTAEHNAKAKAAEEAGKRAAEIHQNFTTPYNGLMLEFAKGRQKGQELANEAAEINNNFYRNAGPMRQMGRMGTRTNTDQYGQTQAVRGGAAAKPAVSDARLKAVAEAVTPEQMQMAFGRKFYDTDANIQKRTGMSRDQLMKTLSDQYRSHILAAGENAMNEDDFIRQAVGKYGFWDRDDLGRLMTSMNDARSKNPTKHGFGWFGFGRRNAEEEYARRNPAFYKQQKALIEEISGIKGINPELKNQALRNPVFVRHYRKGIEKGLSPDRAFLYGADAIRRGAR